MSAKPKTLLPLLFLLAACGGAKPEGATLPAEDPLESVPAPRDTPRASTLVKEGEALLQKGDGAGAKAKFDAQLAQTPNDARALLGLGLAEELLGHAEAAEKAYRAAVQSDDTLAEAHNNLALVLRDQDRLEEALGELEKAVQHDPKLASARANLALTYEDLGRADEAQKAYEGAVRLTPGDAMLRANFGLFLLGRGDQEGAVRELRAGLEAAQGDRAVLVAVGNGMRRAGKPDEAVRALDAAVKGGDGKPTPALLSELALAQHAAGLKAEAKASLEEALKLDAKYASAHYVLASLLAGEGDKKGAVQHYQRCIELEPKGPLAEKAREKLKAVKGGK